MASFTQDTYTSRMQEDVHLSPESHDVFLQLTQLNDELRNMQRELAQKNADLERLAYFDTLTGLFNRRSIMEKVDEWLRHMERYDGRLCVIMLDVDHFKAVNDLYGHRIGDRVLTDVAHLMRESVRQTDFVGRYGGDEFLIILPQTDAGGAAVMAERTRVAIQGSPMHDAAGNAFPVTASLGVAEWCKGDNEDLIITRADAALSRAQDAGRNRVEIRASSQ